MNPLEQELHYPMGETLPEGGSKLEVAAGVYWVRMPLPFALNHINLYLVRDQLEGTEGWTLIDCGISSDEIKAHWEHIFAQHLDGLPILRVICTHMHPDHVGLAYWITERFACPLWMTMGEYALGRVLSAHLPGADSASTVAYYQSHGVTDPAALASLSHRGNGYFKSLVPDMPKGFRRLRADELVTMGGAGFKDQWQIIIGTGHSPEHASLYCAKRKLLLAGDMVLPRISTNVSVFELEQEANPLQWFLDSLTQYQHCAPDTLVFPSHGKPFQKMHRRIEQLREHHEARLQEVREACKEKACSALDIVPIMFKRELDLHQLTFALGEALAHLHALWYSGELKRIRSVGQVTRFTIA
jgi:glyoxylase-like metal-dependent hydrolase (beta-lactamase superfamily II)